MVAHASAHPPLVKRAAPAGDAGQGLAVWQRRTIEVLVAVLAFAIWGTLAYVGGIRLVARAEGISLARHWLLDVMSLVIGVSGSIAGVSALWAIGMRALGRNPGALVGAPDDSPADAAYRTAYLTGEHRVRTPRDGASRP